MASLVRYVDPQAGDDAHDGTSWVQAKRTIRSALDLIDSVIADSYTIKIKKSQNVERTGEDIAGHQQQLY